MQVEADDAIHNCAGVVLIPVDGLETLAQRSAVGGRNPIVNVVEGRHGLSDLIAVDPSAISTSLALFEGAVEPDNGVKSTLDHGLRRGLFSCGLHQ